MILLADIVQKPWYQNLAFYVLQLCGKVYRVTESSTSCFNFIPDLL